MISLQIADKIADAALAAARDKDASPLAVAVLNEGGHIVVFKKEDNTSLLRFDIARAKAWGALGMGVGSRALAPRAASHPSFFGALNAMSDGKVVPVPGGVLIRDGAGAIIGAVGISGDGPDVDEACALAGITAAGLTADTGGDH